MEEPDHIWVRVFWVPHQVEAHSGWTRPYTHWICTECDSVHQKRASDGHPNAYPGKFMGLSCNDSVIARVLDQ